MSLTRRLLLKLAALFWYFWRGSVAVSAAQTAPESPQPFGTDYPNLDSLATGEWWKKTAPRGPAAPPPMDVPRDQVVAFALYTHERGVLKLTAQLYPLKPGEPRVVRLEFQKDGQWTEAGSRDATQRANETWKRALAEYEPPPLDDAIAAELGEFVARRTAEGGAPPES